nr:hypothetical protein [Stenotrophomonas geniculata]
MDQADLREVYFLHYQVVREGQAALFQRAFADVCSISPNLEAAATQAENYLRTAGWYAVEVLSWRPAVHADLPEMDKKELDLLAEARLRTPPVFALIVEGVDHQLGQAGGPLH